MKVARTALSRLTTNWDLFCVSSWRLEEALGATRVDSVGPNDLLDTNTVDQAAGKIGNSALFVAANSERLTISDGSQVGLNPGLLDLSISVWFYPIGTTGNAAYYIVTKGLTGGASPAEGYGIAVRGTATPTIGDLITILFGDATASFIGCQFHTTDKYNFNTWNHIFVYYDRNDKVHVYLNGKRQDPSFGSSDKMDAVDHTNQDCTPAASFALGCLSGNTGAFSNFFDGRIDAVQIFILPNMTINIPAMAAALWNSGQGREM